MNTLEYRFIEPLDLLFLRGNKLFGDPGSFGESMVPPWPSVAAGALRSRMLIDDGIDLTAFVKGEIPHPSIGTPENLGEFTVTAFNLASCKDKENVEALFVLPADLFVSEDNEGNPYVYAMTPIHPANGLMSSSPFTMLPALARNEHKKSVSSYWLKESGWYKYLKGELPTAQDLTKSSELWSLDHRIGVGLDITTRRAVDGRLFSIQAVAMKPGVGFLAAVSGAIPPNNGMVRLGGDGRAAAIRSVSYSMPEPDYAAISQARRCRLILTSPGIFSNGWKLTGTDTDGNFRFGKISGRIVCAAVSRAETVSGWNLAKKEPKSALRAAPIGSVYWLDELDASPEELRKLTVRGLWGDPCEDSGRRAEGYNRIIFAAF